MLADSDVTSWPGGGVASPQALAGEDCGKEVLEYNLRNMRDKK